MFFLVINACQCIVQCTNHISDNIRDYEITYKDVLKSCLQ